MKTDCSADYNSVLPLLGTTGCPFCKFLRRYQASLLKTAQPDLRHLCNYHAWALAAVQPVSSAAEIFLQLLLRAYDEARTCICDLCQLLTYEEESRMDEFLTSAAERPAVRWVRSQRSGLCLEHGKRLEQRAPAPLGDQLKAVERRYRESLIADLTYMKNNPRTETEAWNVIGQAAEFLVAQRGRCESRRMNVNSR